MSDELRVLYIPYQNVHFLLNRSQCSSSLFTADLQALKSPFFYLNELIPVDGISVLLFDLHKFCQDFFQAKTDTGAELSIIVHLDQLVPETRNWLKKKVFSQLKKLSVDTDHIAFRLPSNTAMHELDPDLLRPHGKSVRDHLIQRGVIAAHPEKTSMGFFLDIDYLLRSKLLFFSKRHQTVQSGESQ